MAGEKSVLMCFAAVCILLRLTGEWGLGWRVIHAEDADARCSPVAHSMQARRL